MLSSPSITIGDRVYRKNPEVDRYQIHYDDLDGFEMRQIPVHSHVEVMGMPEPPLMTSMECYGLNTGDKLSVYGGPSLLYPDGDREGIMRRLHRAFPYHDLDDHGIFRNPSISLKLVDGGILAHVYLGYDFTSRPRVTLREAVTPYFDGNQRLCHPYARVFICHASEDKPAARSLAAGMKHFGADVWLDEWEVRVGDSIVQKISDALGDMTHIAVLLSSASVSKPWVRKELSSALMQKLSVRDVGVLPVLLDDCTIPAILADIRYADARSGIELALPELHHSLLGTYAHAQIARVQD